MVKIFHYRDRCIGCANCVLVAPQYWYMDFEDGKANLTDGVAQKRFWVQEVWNEEFQLLKKAEANCPVNVIRVERQ